MTSTSVPVDVADGAPVVKLPTVTNYASRISSQLDSIPPLVRLPETSIPDGQSSLEGLSLDTPVCGLRPAEPQRESLDGLRQTVELFFFC